MTLSTDIQRTDGRELEIVRRLDALHVAVVSDCLDQLGVRDNVMTPHIRPLTPQSRVSGYAATVRLIEVDVAPADSKDWYRGEIEALERMQPGDVMIGSKCLGSYWGELLATASARRGVRGIVADAYTRDTLALREMAFPTFVAGISAQDSLGRVDVEDDGVVVECGGVEVHQGDLVIADADGVAVIPSEIAPEVVSRAEQKVAAEHDMRASLREGMPLSQAFARYRIL